MDYVIEAEPIKAEYASLELQYDFEKVLEKMCLKIVESVRPKVSTYGQKDALIVEDTKEQRLLDYTDFRRERRKRKRERQTVRRQKTLEDKNSIDVQKERKQEEQKLEKKKKQDEEREKKRKEQKKEGKSGRKEQPKASHLGSRESLREHKHRKPAKKQGK